MTGRPSVFAQSFFHGTKASLAGGDLIQPGWPSNFGDRRRAAHVYLAATLDAAVWGAELAVGDGGGRVYVVEPTGQIEDDPDLTNTKFPGNPTKSYRTSQALRVLGEVVGWSGHTAEQVQAMKDHVAHIEKTAQGTRESESGPGSPSG